MTGHQKFNYSLLCWLEVSVRLLFSLSSCNIDQTVLPLFYRKLVVVKTFCGRGVQFHCSLQLLQKHYLLWLSNFKSTLCLVNILFNSSDMASLNSQHLEAISCLVEHVKLQPKPWKVEVKLWPNFKDYNEEYLTPHS